MRAAVAVAASARGLAGAAGVNLDLSISLLFSSAALDSFFFRLAFFSFDASSLDALLRMKAGIFFFFFFFFFFFLEPFFFPSFNLLFFRSPTSTNKTLVSALCFSFQFFIGFAPSII